MQVAVERRPGSQVALTVTVEAAKVQERMEQLFQKYARRVTIPGFRPGKAPRSLVEGRIDRAALLQDAVEDIIDITYKEALQEEHLEPLERGEIKDLQTGDDMSVTYQVVVSVRPEVKIPDYQELVVRHTATLVTDEQLDAEIDRLRERGADYAELTDEGIETGDFVTIDYTMKIDGESYPEGDTAGYPLEVGSDTFFPELNDALIGLKKDDTTTISTTYAEDYSNAELAGKTATFDIVVGSIRRRVKPEIDDAWVATLSGGALTTVDELRTHFRRQLEEMAERMDRDHVRSTLISQLVDKTDVEVPSMMAEEEYEHLMEELEHQLSHEHTTMEDYARSQGRTVVDIENEQQMIARDMVRRSLILQEIARKEQIYVTDEELDTLVTMESYSRGERSLDKIRRNLGKLRKELEKSGQLDRMASRLYHEKILTFLEEHADVEVEGRPKPQGEEAAPGPEAIVEETASTPETPIAETTPEAEAVGGEDEASSESPTT